MPIYEYKCGTCSNEFEVRRGFGDDPNAACPNCQGRADRVFSAVPILFKGSGFYVTDYAAKQYNNTDSESRGEKSTKDEGIVTAY